MLWVWQGMESCMEAVPEHAWLAAWGPYTSKAASGAEMKQGPLLQQRHYKLLQPGSCEPGRWAPGIP